MESVALAHQERVRDAGLGATWQFIDAASVGIDWQYEDRRSDAPGFDYVDRLYRLMLKVRL